MRKSRRKKSRRKKSRRKSVRRKSRRKSRSRKSVRRKSRRSPKKKRNGQAKMATPPEFSKHQIWAKARELFGPFWMRGDRGERSGYVQRVRKSKNYAAAKAALQDEAQGGDGSGRKELRWNGKNWILRSSGRAVVGFDHGKNEWMGKKHVVKQKIKKVGKKHVGKQKLKKLQIKELKSYKLPPDIEDQISRKYLVN